MAQHVTFITRLRPAGSQRECRALPPIVDGVEPAPERRPGQVGRPRKKGTRLLTLKQILADPATTWTALTVSAWYDHQDQQLELTTGTGLWYQARWYIGYGKPAVAIRWVLIRDPEGKADRTSALDPVALLSTNQALSPEQIISAGHGATFFVRRWLGLRGARSERYSPVEVTFEEARAHLGLETQRQGSDLAIARTTPVILGLFSLVMLLAEVLKEHPAVNQPDEFYVREASWYQKPWPTFSDAIASVRSKIWHPRYFCMSGRAETQPL